MLSLGYLHLIAALVDTAAWSSKDLSAFGFLIVMDAWPRQHASVLPSVLLLLVDTQLCMLCVRLATCVLFLCRARLITPLIEVQRDVDILLRDLCFWFADRG